MSQKVKSLEEKEEDSMDPFLFAIACLVVIPILILITLFVWSVLV